jgi:hypothetical protein
MKAALVGFAISKVKEFMSEALPGFDHHLNEAERKNAQQHQSGSFGHEQSGGYASGSQGSGGYGSGGYGSGTGSQASTRGESSHGGDQHDQQHHQHPVGANPGLNI